MESTEVTAARLVLGYLRVQGCRSVYKEFLKNCRHLQRYNLTNMTKNKCLPTRFMGLTLEDILTEYSEIYHIVQGKLEATDYYNEHHSKTSLVKQLIYLLNKIQSSVCSTPCVRSPAAYSHMDETSPYADHNSDVETTPVDNLPGNIQYDGEEPIVQKTPRRRSKSEKSTTFNSVPSSTEKNDAPEVLLSSEVLAQTLLEKKEFHEKIAHTINKIAEKQCTVSTELDKTVRSVVEETEADPMFDKILEEIIGSSNIIIDSNKAVETSSSATSSAQNATEDTENIVKTSNKNADREENNTNIIYLDNNTVDEQNNEAIRSIIENSKMSTETQTQQTENLGKSEVIVFDGSLDKYIVSNTYSMNMQVPQTQNPLYINTNGGLLMVPTSVPTNIPSGNIRNPGKQYYIFNQQQPVNCYIPPTVITEQDILAMPTVIVSDDRMKQPVLNAPVLHPKPVTAASTSLKPICPKPQIKISTDPEYINLYGDPKPATSGLKKVLYPKKSSKTKVNVVIEANKEASNVIVPNTGKIISKDLPKLSADEEVGSSTAGDVVEEKKTTNPHSTKSDQTMATPTSSEVLKKNTPKSGSHIRNLDFSTPPKITSTHKKSMKLKNCNKKSPAHKKQAAKSLFKEEKQTNENTTSKNANPWDADLRSSLPQIENSKRQTSKRKRSPVIRKSRKRCKKSESENIDLNTTEQDGALLRPL